MECEAACGNYQYHRLYRKYHNVPCNGSDWNFIGKNETVGYFYRKKTVCVYRAALLVIPVFTGFLLRMFIKDALVYGTIVLMAAVPIANLPFMRVEETGGDGTLLSKGIILSTILSLVTIPIVTSFV